MAELAASGQFPSSTITRRDIALAGAAAAAALVVYVLTLAPGLIAITDTPKFQFVGRILGMGHPPGYPLYVVVSHVFGYLPIGSLAYRINLMSASCSALTVGLTFLAMRLLGIDRLVACVSVLAMAYGSTLWYVSTIAEVYSLNALLVASVTVALLVWRQSQRAAWFYAAVALVGLSLGNHTTAVFLIPATAAFACLEAPRFAFRPRTVVLSAAIVAAALLQYLFIVIRTRQGAWGDMYASNLPDLARAAIGTEYFRDVMPGGFQPFVANLFSIVRRMFERELSTLGLALAVLGTVALWRRSKAALGFLLVAALEYAVFAAAYTPHEFEVFLVPAFLALWVQVGAGAQWLTDSARARAGLWAVAPLAVALAVAPIWQLARNYRSRDLSHARADMRFFDALFDRLPDGSVLLHEDFLVDRMVYYKTLGEQATRGRSVLALMPAQRAPVERAWRDGYRIFAFPAESKEMRLLDGAEFSYTPLDLSGGTLARYLDDLPRGAIVAVGVPARYLPGLASSRHLPLHAIGFTRRVTALDAAEGLAVVGVRGAGAVENGRNPVAVQARLEATDPDAQSPARPAIVVHADRDIASVEFGGREIVRTAAGMAVAVWTGSRLAAAFVLSTAAPSPPTLPTPYAVYPLEGLRERQPIGATPIDLTPTTSSGMFVYKATPGASRFVMYVGRARPLAPALLATSAPNFPRFDVRTFDRSQALVDLVRALEEDRLPASRRLLDMPHVYRIAIETTWPMAAAVQIGLGGVPDVAVGRLLDGAQGLVHGLALGTHLTRIDERTMSLHMARDHHEHLVGAGWSSVQADAVGPYRETVDHEAELLLPLEDPEPWRVGVQFLPLPSPGGLTRSVELRVNGVALPGVAPRSGWQRHWWDLPAGALNQHVNSAVLVVSPGTTRIAVSDLLLEKPARD